MIRRKRGKDSVIIIIPITLVILLLIWGVAVYNHLITERLRVQTQWSQIDVALKQRFDLVSNLVETIKDYAAHEKKALQTVADARSRYLLAEDARGQVKASTRLSGVMGCLMAVAEYCPELKAGQNFLHLQQQISATEEKLANYRQSYNDTVLRYNSLFVTVPADLITRLFHLQKEGFFKAEGTKKVVITVKF